MEVELQRDIKLALEQVGLWVIRTGVQVKRSNRGTNSGVPGMPDLCLPAWGWIEVKQPGHTLSPRQISWHERAKSEGVRVATAYSVSDALGILKSWGWQG